MQVSEQTGFTIEVATELRRLLPKLSSSAAAPSDEFIGSIVKSDSSRLLVAREGDAVLGFLTLVVFRIPTGVRAWIEDVVVDSAA